MAVAGSNSRLEAKIGGITPAVLILSGMNEVSPPLMRLPVWRLGYWTKSRRCERSMKTIARTTITAKALIVNMAKPDRAPCWVRVSICQIPLGRLATIPAKMIKDTPLPTPRLVICSPIHIRNMVPPVRVTIVETRKNIPG